MDIQWLQRDFGLYIVGLWDTYHASHLLELEGHGYAFLLDYYCNISTDKKYQLADWRLRPLTFEMLLYARTDTHYLLYIYDRMRNELISKSNPETLNLIHATLQRSAQTAMKLYVKDIYDAETGLNASGWAVTIRKCRDPLNEMGFAVYRALHAWRDHVARQEDESHRFVLPNHMLFSIARIRPCSVQDLIGCCTPTPLLVRMNAGDIVSLIEHTVTEAQVREPVKKPEKKKEVMHVRFDAEKVHVATKETIEIQKADTSRFFVEKTKIGKTHDIVVSLAATSKLYGVVNYPVDSKRRHSFQAVLPFETMEMRELNFGITEEVRVAEIAQEPDSVQIPKESETETVEDTIKPEAVIAISKPPSPKRKIDNLELSDLPTPMLIKKGKKSKKNKIATDSFIPFDYASAPAMPKPSTNNNLADFKPHGLPSDSNQKVSLWITIETKHA